MPASAIASAIVSAFAIESVIAIAAVQLATALITSTIVSKLFAPNSDSGTFSNNADPGVRSRLSTSTENKVGVGYGNFWCKGAVIHGENTPDFTTAYYTLVLSEAINAAPNSLQRVYWQEFLLTLDGNGWVTNAVDAQGNSVSDFNNNIRVQFFANGLPFSRAALPNTTWFQDNTKLLSGYACVVITVVYNRDKQIFNLQDMTFNLQNALSAPGSVIQDYITNSRYGGGISASLIDLTSLSQLNAYAAEQLPYTEGGTTFFANRYAINGIVNTNTDIWTNLEEICRCSGAIMQVQNNTGKFGVWIDRLGNPVAFLGDNDIVGKSTITLSDLTEVPNQLVTNFADGSSQFKGLANTFTFKTPGNLLPNTAPEVQQQISFALINNSVQAKRLATLELNQWQLDLSYVFSGDHRLLGLQSGDVVAITDTRNGWTNKLFRIASISEQEGQDGSISVEVSTKEYSADIYNDGAILAYDPAPNVNTPSARFINNYTPATPTVVGSVPAATIPLFNLNLIIPAVRVDYLEVYYSTDPVLNFVLLFSQRATNASGAFVAGTLSFPVTGLVAGTYYFRTKYFNSDIASNLSAASTPFIWDPQPSSSSSGVSVNFDWSPPNVLVPAQSDGSSPITGQTPILCLYIGVSQIQFSTAATDLLLPNNQWRITSYTPTTGLTVSAPVVSALCAQFTVTAMTAQSATLTVAVNYKTTVGTVVSIGTTILQVVQQRAGSAGTQGWSAYLNFPILEFNQGLDGIWPGSRNMIASFTNGTLLVTKTQPVSVDTNGNIVYGTPTGSTDITVATNGAGSKIGNVVFTHTPTGLSTTGLVNSFPVSAALTVDKAQVFFPQNIDGTYSPGSQSITATVAQTNGSATLTAVVVATIVSNGNITLTYPTPTPGITTVFIGNGTKTTAVQFTHTPTGATGSASAVAQIYPIANADNFGGVTVSVSGVVQGTIAAPVAITQTYSNGNTFSKAADGGAWTPTPVANVITTNNTIVANRQTTILARIIRVITYNVLTGVWTDTPDTSQDLNPTRFTLGPVTSSVSQYSRSITYLDTDGTQIDVLQVNAIVGGSRGAPGPANVTRFGRFATNALALTTGAPTTASGVDNINWFRSPSVFQANDPYTHTTSQFVNNVTAGAPYQATEALSGSGGGAYLAGLQEIYTETITPGHTASTTSTEQTSFSITGNSGNYFPTIATFYYTNTTIAFGNNIWVIAGDGGLFYSSNLFAWSQPVTTPVFTTVLFANNMFVAVGDLGNIWYSSTGTTWTRAAGTGTNLFLTVKYVNSTWVATGLNSTLYYSSNGSTWTQSTTVPSGVIAYTVAFNSPTWILTTSGGTYFSQDNLVTWASAGFSFQSFHAEYANGKFVITTADGIYYSTTGISNWIKSTYVAVSVYIAFSKPQFINGAWIIGNYAGIYTSPDAAVWTQRLLTTPRRYIYSIIFANGYYVGVGEGGSIYYSTNTTTWTQATYAFINDFGRFISFSAQNFYPDSLVFANNTWTAVGSNGTVAYSTTTPPTTWLRINTTNNAIAFSIPFFTQSQGQFTFSGTINLTSNLSTQATLGADFVSRINAYPNKPTELTFTLNASNNVQINHSVIGNANPATFIVTQSSGGSTPSAIVVGTQTIVDGSSPSTLSYLNVQVANNRSQLQITAPPTIIGNIYIWPITQITSTGTFTEGAPIIFDAQTVLQGVVYEGRGTFTSLPSITGLTGTKVALRSDVVRSLYSAPPGYSSPFVGFNFFNGQYIAQISYTGGQPLVTVNSLLVSTDLATWIERVLPAAAPTLEAYGNGIYVGEGGGEIYTSTNLITWSVLPAAPLLTIASPIYFFNGTFIQYGDGALVTSPDLINWTTRTFPLTPSMLAAAFVVNVAGVPGAYVAASYTVFPSTAINYATSTDAINWGTQTLLTAGGLTTFGKLRYVNNRFFIVGGDISTNLVYSTNNGASWQVSTLPVGFFASDIAFGNGVYVLCGFGNNVLVSSDLVTWATRSLNDPAGLLRTWRDIYFDGINFAIFGDDFEIAGYSVSQTAWALGASQQLALIPASFPGITANLQALTTNNYVFLQGTVSTSSTLVVTFSSGAASGQQAIDIATAFNTVEVAYTASVSGNVVTIISSQQFNYTDITHGVVTQGTNGNIVIGDFTLVKVQDGRAPNTVPQGTQTTVSFTKAGNYGVGSTTLTLDFGQAFNATGYNNAVRYSGTINGVSTGTVILGNVTPYVAVQQLLQAMGYVVATVNATTLRAYDVDTTAGGDLTILVTSNGSNPTGTFAIVSTVIDTGATEIVVGDPNRWAIPVNTGKQVN